MNITQALPSSETSRIYLEGVTSSDLFIPDETSSTEGKTFLCMQIDYLVTIEKIKTLINFSKFKAETSSLMHRDYFLRLKKNLSDEKNSYCRSLYNISGNLQHLFSKPTLSSSALLDFLSKRILDSFRDLSRLCITLEDNKGYAMSYAQEFSLRVFGHKPEIIECQEIVVGDEIITETFNRPIPFLTENFDITNFPMIEILSKEPEIDLTLNEDLFPLLRQIEKFWNSENPKASKLLLCLAETKAVIGLSSCVASFKPNFEEIVARISKAEESLVNLTNFSLIVDRASELFNRAEIASNQLSKIIDAGLDVVVCHEKRSRIAKLGQIRLNHMQVQIKAFISSLSNRITRVKEDLEN
jgi:hypothetical protein